MSIDADQGWPDEQSPPVLRKTPRRWPVVLAVMAGLLLAGAGGLYGWMNLDKFVQLSAPDASEAGSAPGDKAMLTDLMASQQKAEEDLASVTQALADQGEQLKSITAQLAAMAAKIEALQTPAAPPPPAATAPPNARAEVSPKPTKTPSRAKKPAAGPISVGGAPLNAASGPDRR